MPDNEPLKAHQRRLQIVQQVQDQGSVRVADLVRAFLVSDTAIRRDLDILESRGRLRRIHGGAVASVRSQATQSFQAKAREHPQDKARIGIAAASLVNSGESILLDSGTTALEVGRALVRSFTGTTPLTIVTNSLPVVVELQEWNSVHLNLLGGILLPRVPGNRWPSDDCEPAALSSGQSLYWL